MNITYNQAKNMEIEICEACQLGNMIAAPIPLSKTAEYNKNIPLKRISTDPVPMGFKSQMHMIFHMHTHKQNPIDSCL